MQHFISYHHLGADDRIHAGSIGVLGCQNVVRGCYLGYSRDWLEAELELILYIRGGLYRPAAATALEELLNNGWRGLNMAKWSVSFFVADF